MSFVVPQQTAYNQRIKLIPMHPRDGMPDCDDLGFKNPHVSPRVLILGPGTTRDFSLQDRLNGIEPATNNLCTYNENVSNRHAEVTTGQTKTTIWLTDLGSPTGTFVDHMVPDPERLGEQGVKWEQLPPWQPVELKDGAKIRLGKDPLPAFDADVDTSQGGMILPPQWTLIVEPVDPDYEKRCLEAANMPLTRAPVSRDAKSNAGETTSPMSQGLM